MRTQTPFFSAPHHSAWFVLTAVMFVVAGMRLIGGQPDVSQLFCGLHTLILLNAVSAVYFDRVRDDAIYTVDCIWYNLFMVEMHGLALIMFALTKSPVGL